MDQEPFHQQYCEHLQRLGSGGHDAMHNAAGPFAFAEHGGLPYDA